MANSSNSELDTQNPYQQQLKINKCTVHFIYSFMLNLYSQEEDTENKQDKEEDTENKQDEEKKYHRLRYFYGFLFENDKKWSIKKPEDRKGVTTNLEINGKNKTLYLDSETLDYSTIVPYKPSAKNTEINPESDIELSRFITINDNGSGIITLSLTISSKEGSTLTAMDIHKIYNLVPINTKSSGNDDLYCLSKKKETETEKETLTSLFDIFIFELKNKVIKPLEIMAKKSKGDKKTLWIDEIAIPESKSKRVWQSPITLTDIELQETKPQSNGFWDIVKNNPDDDHTNQQKTRELLTLCTRMLKGKLMIEENELSYLYRNPVSDKTELPKNYSWHTDVYIGFHGRGGMIVHYEDSRESSLVTELNDSYLSLMEILRARWHLCVVFSELITSDLNTINNFGKDSLWKFTKILLNRRELYIRFLSDPTMYAFEGGVVSKIAQTARTDFGVDNLSKIVSEKFIALEKYYRECIDLALLSRKS